MSPKTASQDALEELHAAVAKSLADRLKSGEWTAADASAAIKFLKDNGIQAVLSTNSPLRELVDDLPDDIETDIVVPFASRMRP